MKSYKSDLQFVPTKYPGEYRFVFRGQHFLIRGPQPNYIVEERFTLLKLPKLLWEFHCGITDKIDICKLEAANVCYGTFMGSPSQIETLENFAKCLDSLYSTLYSKISKLKLKDRQAVEALVEKIIELYEVESNETFTAPVSGLYSLDSVDGISLIEEREDDGH